VAKAGVDLLLVTGLRDEDGSAALERQFDAHHYSDGLSFPAPGTASNNSEASRSGGQPLDPMRDASFDWTWGEPPAPDSRADLAARAFGLDAFARLEGAGGQDEASARAMMTALWPATWGYFLAQMIGFDGPLTLAARDWAQAHAIGHLRPAGPLPTLRCGNQPYGLLPVTGLDSWTPPASQPGARRLAEILVSLRDQVWRPASAAAPRLRPDDPLVSLTDVLGTSPRSTRFKARAMMGTHFLHNLWTFLGKPLDAIGFWPRLALLTQKQANAFGINFQPPMARASYAETAHDLTVPLAGDPAAIARLRDADADALAAQPPEAAALLETLLRHGLLREHAEAAARRLDSRAHPREQLVRDAELVDLVAGQPSATTWSWQRSQTVDGVNVKQAIAGDPGLRALREALGVRAATDAATLERRLGETLDAAGHRLDAWITSLAHWRLAELRERAPQGIVVGGYGWVENLRPATGALPVTALPEGEPGPLWAPAADPGYIHAPSLSQASAAALLRNAHLAHGGQPDSPFAIDLSSARVRLAQRLFAGVRQGQPLGALLGYMLERRLHETQLDDLIDGIRAIAPLPGAQTPAGVRRLVADGLQFGRLWNDGAASVLARLAITAGSPRDKTLRGILQELESAIDAAADAVNAETAFQMVRGNLPRAAAALEAISAGEAPPPDLGFIATPRTGQSVTHRVAMPFAVTGAPSPAGWAGASPRTRACPALAAWAGRLLGPIEGLRIEVEVLGGDGSVIALETVSAASLALTPLDFIAASGGPDAMPAELAQRVLDAAQASNPAQTGTRRLRPAGLSGLAAIRFTDLIEVARHAQRLLAGARPMTAADLQAPGEDPDRGLDLDEFEHRVAQAEAEIAAVRDRLVQAVASGQDLREAMLGAAAFGVAGAVPLAMPMDAPAALLAQAAALVSEVTRRATPPAAAAGTDQAARLESQLARLRTVFGSSFLALPHFRIADPAALNEARKDAPGLLGGDPLAAYTWLQRMERVRAPLARMARPLRACELLGLSEKLDLTVIQHPHVPGQPWLGLQPLDNAERHVSLVLQAAPKDLAQPLCGLLADEWTEVIPSPNETTAIAFQHDMPDSAAPQAILLAVPPVLREPWRLGRLNRVLMETLDLARLRATQPGDLASVGHYLPAVHLAFNLAGDAVSTDFGLK
jgi:hypothetical protein